MKCLDKAAVLLGRRIYGAEELKKKLKTYGYHDEEIGITMALLLEKGYMDDLEFAKAYIRDQATFQRKGPELITLELKRKEVESSLIQSALETEYTALMQEENARYLLKKWKQSSRQYDMESLTRKLLRKGYSYQIVKTCLGNFYES